MEGFHEPQELGEIMSDDNRPYVGFTEAFGCDKKLKKKQIYKKALQQITMITRTEIREKLGLDPRCPRDLELATDALYLAVEIAALALSGKRTKG
jgi:hypothetical protein